MRAVGERLARLARMRHEGVPRGPGGPPYRAGGLREVELLADALHRYAILVRSGALLYPFDRLEVRLATEAKRLMVYRQEELRARVLSHLPRLFRCAMCVNPGIVRAYGHDRQVIRP